MYDHSLHCRRKRVCRYCLQAFSIEKILKSHIKYCFKINGEQTIKMPNKGEYVKVKNFERKIIKIQMSLIPANVKNMLLVVMVIN